jgi:hypothetical protein
MNSCNPSRNLYIIRDLRLVHRKHDPNQHAPVIITSTTRRVRPTRRNEVVRRRSAWVPGGRRTEGAKLGWPAVRQLKERSFDPDGFNTSPQQTHQLHWMKADSWLAWFNAISFKYSRFMMHCLDQHNDSRNHVWQVVHGSVVLWILNSNRHMDFELAAYPARLSYRRKIAMISR